MKSNQFNARLNIGRLTKKKTSGNFTLRICRDDIIHIYSLLTYEIMQKVTSKF